MNENLDNYLRPDVQAITNFFQDRKLKLKEIPPESMKLTLVSDLDSRRKKGYVLFADKLAYDETYAMHIKVRIVGEWKRPRWLSIQWFV